LALRFGQFRRSPGRALIDQTGDPAPEETVEVVADRLLTKGQHLRDLTHCHAIGNGQEHMETLDQT
jgi:hypothetical protein